MHAIKLEKPLNLANKINLEQKQDVSVGVLNLTFGLLDKDHVIYIFISVMKINIGKSLHFV